MRRSIPIQDVEHQVQLKEFLDSQAAGRHEWLKKNHYYYDLLTRYLKLAIPENSSVLEIGCGTGELLNALKPSYGVGIDISGKMVDVARSQFPHLHFIEADAHNLPIEDKFDFVVISDTIGYLQDVQSVFSELKKVVRSDTRVVITYFNYLWRWILVAGEKLGLKMKQPEQSWLSLEDIANLLHLAGFEVIRKYYKILFPLHVPVVSAFLNRVVANLPFFWKLSLTEIVVARLAPDRPRDYSVTVVVPCRNEKGNIAGVIERTPHMGSHTDIIFVEGHSTDETLEEIKRQIAHHPQKDIQLVVQDGKGKGNAVRNGFAKARGEVLIILDADLSVAPEDLPKFYEALRQGKGEFINGCRLVYPMEIEAMRFLNTLGNKFFSRAFTYLLEQPFKDTLCGTKAVSKAGYGKIAANRHYFGDFDPFGDFDLIFGAAKLNLKIVELPVRYRERTYGETNIRRFYHGWLLAKMCLFALKKIKWI